MLLSWPRRKVPCDNQASQSLWGPLRFPIPLQKTSSMLSPNPDEQTRHFFVSLKTKQKLRCIFLQVMSTITMLSFIFFQSKKHLSLLRTRPSGSGAGSCWERKAAAWQRKETAKELPEHCAKILRCWPLTVVCIIKEKQQYNVLVFPVSPSIPAQECEVIFFLWFSSRKGDLTCLEVAPLILETHFTFFFSHIISSSSYSLFLLNYFREGNLGELWCTCVKSVTCVRKSIP